MDNTAEVLAQEKVIINMISKHLVKTVLTSILVTILGSIGTISAFYYNTNNDIKDIIENDQMQDESIIQMQTTLISINEKLGSTNTVTAVSDTKIKGLETQINQVQKQQEIMQQTMMQILVEIKRK